VKARVRRIGAALEDLPPERIALLVAVGLALGVFPIMGFPTALCLLAALGLRLNAAALQALNNASTPLQLALALPLARVGAWLCRGATPGGGSTAGTLAGAALHAVAGWACICVPLGALLYVILVFTMRRSRPSWLGALKGAA
jgi:hypothetical protein